MKPRAIALLTLGVALGCLLSWVLLDGLPWVARSFTTFLLVPLPALLLLQAQLADQMPQEAEREAVYLSSAVSVWALAGFAMLAARFSDMSRAELRLQGLDLSTLVLATGVTVGAGVGLMAMGRLLRVRESPLLEYLMPRTGAEKIAFGGLSISAGIAEELVFRSFLIAALVQAGASLPVAVALSIAIFALSHGYQGLAGVFRVALLGGVLTAPFLLTDSVYPSILAHIILDLLAGLVLADWLLDSSGEDPSRH